MLPYVAPFVVAALFAWMIEPLMRFVTRRLGDRKIIRIFAAAFFVLTLAAGILFLLFVFFSRIGTEISTLARVLPGWVRSVSSEATGWIESLSLDWTMIDTGVEEALRSVLREATALLTSLASRMAATVARIALQTASLLPQGVLFVILALLGTFYMCADRHRVIGYFQRSLPERLRHKLSEFRASALRAILSQFRAAMIMLCISFGVMSAGFLLMGFEYAILFAVIIALIDALPVLGSGLFLIPMFLYGLVTQDATLAIGSPLIYLIMIAARNFVEPRVIGRSLGLHPLATMMALYAGLVTRGFIGMLLGPTFLLLCKIALSAQPQGPLALVGDVEGDGEDADVGEEGME